MKLSLIIQGPIKSNGVTFDGSYQEYDSYNNVIRLVNNFKEVTAKIVLVTYINELDCNQIKFLKNLGVQIIELEIINLDFKTIDISFGLLKALNFEPKIRNTSKYYQYRSTLIGLEKLMESGDNSITIKVRTDINFKTNILLDKIKTHDFDLKPIILQYLMYKEIHSLKLIAPAVPDQVFIGRTDVLYRLFLQARDSNFSSNVHQDLCISILNIYGQKSSSLFNIEEKFKNSKRVMTVFNYFLYLFAKFVVSYRFSKIIGKIGILDRKFSETLEWRGSIPPVNYYNFKNRYVKFKE